MTTTGTLAHRLTRTAAVALATGGLALGATACSSSPTPTPAPSTTSATSSSSSSSSTTSSPTSSRTTSSSSTTSGTASGTKCTIKDAKAVVEQSPSGASAGKIGLQVTVTNGGSTPCTVEGYPGVSLVTGSEGQQLGAPAGRAGGTATTITLQPGAKASAPLTLAQASNFPDCGVTAAQGFRIYLPDDTAAQFSQQAQQGCSNASVVLLEVGPFAR